MGNIQAGPGTGAGPMQGPQNQGAIDLWQLLAGIWARKRAVFAIVGVVMVVTAVSLVLTTPRYAAENRLMIESNATGFTAADNQRLPQRADTQGVQSEVEVLTSRDLGLRVINKLKLEDRPPFARRPGLLGRILIRVGLKTPPARERVEERLTRALAENLGVYQINNSRVISINYSSPDGKLSAEIANTIAREYIASTREAKLANTRGAIDWLDGQIAILREKVITSEGEVEKFRAEAGLLRGPSATLNSQQLSELNSQIIVAAAARAEAQAQAIAIRKILKRAGGLESAAALVNSPLVQRLADQKIVLRRQLADLSVTFLPSHPRMQRIGSEIRSIDRQMRKQALKAVRNLEDKARLAQAREKSLRASLDTLKGEASELNQGDVKLRALEREAKSDRESLESLLKRYRDASARAGLAAQPADARIISHASAPSLPTFPKTGPMLLLAFVSATILALVYVFLREVYALNSGTGAAPAQPRARVARPVRASSNAGASVAAPAQALWSRIQQARSGERRGQPERRDDAALDAASITEFLDGAVGSGSVRRIAISGAEKSDIAPALALEVARHFAASGRNTLLIEGGVQRTGICAMLGLDENDDGLAELLLGRASFGKVVASDPQSNVKLVSAGPGFSEAAKLIDSERMDIVLDAYDQAYDLVILLVPDIVSGGAAAALAKRADLVVLIADKKAGRGWGRKASDAVRELHGPGHVSATMKSGTITVGDHVPGIGARVPA